MFPQRNSSTSTGANIIVSHLNNTGITKLGKICHVHCTVSAQMLLKDFCPRNPRLAIGGWLLPHRRHVVGIW